MTIGWIILALLFVVAVLGMALYGGHIKKGMDALALYRVASCLVVASIISGVISMMSLYLALPAIKGDFTHHDALVDILGILVTVLMGWNIISVVDFKKKAESVEHISGDFSYVISGIMELNLSSFMLAGEKVVLLDNSFNTLESIQKCQNDQIKVQTEKEVMVLISRICDAMKQDRQNEILAGRKERYKYLLSHVDSEYKQSILDFINSAENNNSKTNGDTGLNHFDPQSLHAKGFSLTISDGVVNIDNVAKQE